MLGKGVFSSFARVHLATLYNPPVVMETGRTYGISQDTMADASYRERSGDLVLTLSSPPSGWSVTNMESTG